MGTTNPFTTNGVYNLIQYTGAIGGFGLSTLSVLNAQAGKTYDFTESGGYVTLTVGGDVIGPPIATWNGSVGNTWSVEGNWTPATAPNLAGATANFTGTGAGHHRSRKQPDRRQAAAGRRLRHRLQAGHDASAGRR